MNMRTVFHLNGGNVCNFVGTIVAVTKRTKIRGRNLTYFISR
jgi:hypothetical protein